MPRIIAIILLTACCQLPIGSLAQNWQGLGTGVSNDVRCLYADTVSNLLYAGGSFKYAGGVVANGIASWDGASWDSLNGGDTNCFNSCPPILAIARYNGEIYAGGAFSNMGGLPVNRIAKWNGVLWDSLGSGVTYNGNPGVVGELTVYNNELYVGGGFDTAGTIAANGLAKWNGTQWSDVYNLPNYNSPNPNSILAIEFYQGELYAAGNFYDTGGYSDIVKYDGANWVPLENGILGGMGGINAMAVYQGELYVGGLFYKSAGNVDDNIMKWDGSNWSEVAGGVDGLNGQVHDMTVFNGELYAVGVFQYAGGVPAQYIAKWDGTEWCGLGSVFDNVIVSIEAYNDTLYIGDGFWTIDGDTMNRIAKWTGGNYVDTCGAIIGMEEQLTISNEQITIYPNPTTGVFTVQGASGEIQVYDLFGRLLLRSNKSKVDMRGFAKGMYVYQIKTPDASVRGKIIKQ